jgi:hypothetical protein
MNIAHGPHTQPISETRPLNRRVDAMTTRPTTAVSELPGCIELRQSSKNYPYRDIIALTAQRLACAASSIWENQPQPNQYRSRATSDQMESFDRIKLLAKTITWSTFREPKRTESALAGIIRFGLGILYRHAEHTVAAGAFGDIHRGIRARQEGCGVVQG